MESFDVKTALYFLEKEGMQMSQETKSMLEKVKISVDQSERTARKGNQRIKVLNTVSFGLVTPKGVEITTEMFSAQELSVNILKSLAGIIEYHLTGNRIDSAQALVPPQPSLDDISQESASDEEGVVSVVQQ